jgi:hypothetical protein
MARHGEGASGVGMGPSGPTGLGLVPAMMRDDAFGRLRKIEGTAGHVRATAVLLPERLQRCIRAAASHGMAMIEPGLPARVVAVPVVRLSPPAALRDAASGLSERLLPVRRQPWDQVAAPPSFAGCLPVAGGRKAERRFGASWSERRLSRCGDCRGQWWGRSDRRASAAMGPDAFVSPCFDGWQHCGRSTIHPRPAASSPGCLPVFGWNGGSAFAAVSLTARRGVGCTVRGTNVIWWSHQLRNTAPTPFLYQPLRKITTKIRQES